MKDQTGQEIVVGQTVAISVETGLRIGEVVEVIPATKDLVSHIRVKVDSQSRPGKMAIIRYYRPHRARIIAQATPKPLVLKEGETATVRLLPNETK